MTTPAQNINIDLPAVVYCRQRQWNKTIGPSGPWSIKPSQPWRGSKEVLVRPQSATSPIREDGTRAPKAWSSRWCHGSPPRALRSWVQWGISTTGTEYEKGNCPAFRPDRLLSSMGAVGAGWSLGGSVGFPSGVESIAVTNFRNEVASGIADLGVTLGELRSTVRGITHAGTTILTQVERLAARFRRTRSDIRKFLLTNKLPSRPGMSESLRIRREKEILDAWLQVQFGLKPLMVDIQQSGDALSWLLFEEQRPMRMKFKKGATQKEVRRVTVGNNYQSPSFEASVPLEVETSCHYSCVYDITPGTTRTFQQLGLTNPLSVAWELTAYSWMVDYLTTTGSWIQSLTRLEGASFVEGSVSRIQRIKPAGRVEFIPGSAKVDLIKGFSGQAFEWDSGRFQRSVLTSAPGPALMPAFRNRLNITRMANILAVLGQKL